MKKGTIFLLSIIGTFFLGLSTYISIFGLCSYNYVCSRPHDDSLMAIFLIFLPTLIFSLISFKMKDETFKSWSIFVYAWVPITILLVLLSPEYGNSLLPVEKGTVSFFMSILFVIVSVFIITYKHFSLKKSN